MKVMKDITYLIDDPRPDLPDTAFWNLLFRRLITIIPGERGFALQKRLWTLRSIGLMVEWREKRLKLVPVMGEGNGWDGWMHWEEVRQQDVKPYALEISILLDELGGQDDGK